MGLEEGATDSAEAERYGRYEIVRRLASGGMGEVYLAKSIGAAGFQKHVVIKKILPHLVEHPQTVRGLVREAKLLVMLNHPNIVQVLDLGVEGTDYFMAMEYVHGYNLSTILHYCSKKKLTIPFEACAFVGIHVLDALAYAHELKGSDGTRQNIIHRDVSPQNVMITHEGRVKLTDFGIAKVLSEAEDELTQSLKGKWRYMAPEAVEGRRIDQRYDLFAVGILLFESLCRRNLFGGKRDVDILNKVREARIPPITDYYPNLPEPVIAVTERSLKKDPDQRYQTAKEFAADLRESIQPLSESEAGNELLSFVTSLYQKSEFPLNKPKIVDPNAVDSNPTRSIVLRSRISEMGITPPIGRPRRSAAVVLLATVLVLISSVVAYLAYKILYAPEPKPEKPPVIIVAQKKTDTGQAELEPDHMVVADRRQDGGRVNPNPNKKIKPRPRPVRFTQNVGKRAFRKHQPAVIACIGRHHKPGDPDAFTVTSTIMGSGVVSEVSLQPATFKTTALGRCVTGVAKKIKYPRHDRRNIKFVLPMKLARRNK